MSRTIYLIGTGAISHQHARAIAALNQDISILAADPSPQARASFQEHFPDVTLFESADEMLASQVPDPTDLVIVATPPLFHCSETLRALDTGRHVLCEKPLAMNMDEARQMVTKAKDAQLNLFCCSNRFLGWEPNITVKQLIEEGTLGTPYLVDLLHTQSLQRTGVEYQYGSWWFLDKSNNGGGPLMDWGPYDIACLVDVLEPVRVHVLHATSDHIPITCNIPEDVVFDIETHVTAQLVFERADGSEVPVRYERSAASHAESYDREGIYFPEGHLTWSWLPYGPSHHVTLRTTTSSELYDLKTHPVSLPIDHEISIHAPVHEAIRYIDGDQEARAWVNDHAVANFEIIQTIYQVAETNKPATVTMTTPAS